MRQSRFRRSRSTRCMRYRRGGSLYRATGRGEAIDVSAVIAAVPWFGLVQLFTGTSSLMDSTIAAASRMTSKPIVTVNLWYDRALMEDLFVGLPGRAMQW